MKELGELTQEELEASTPTLGYVMRLERRIEELERYCFSLQMKEKYPSPYDLSTRRLKKRLRPA